MRIDEANRPRLTLDALAEVHELAVELQLDRTALLAGLDTKFISGISGAPSAIAQILVDLHTINRTPTLADGSEPLRHWLTNARLLSASRQEQSIFAAYASILDQPGYRNKAVEPIGHHARKSRTPKRPLGARQVAGFNTQKSSLTGRRAVRMFDDVLLALERHALVFPAHPIAREGGFTIAGSIGPLAAGLMRLEGMYASHFPGPAVLDGNGQPSHGVVEVAVGLHPSGEFVTGFTFVSDVDDGWLARLDAYLEDTRELGGAARVYHLGQRWFEHDRVEHISIRAELERMVGSSLRRHADACLALWSESDERQLERSPIFAMRDNHAVDATDLLAGPQTNQRMNLLGTPGESTAILLRRYAATLAASYLSGSPNASAPLLVNLTGQMPDWNGLLWTVFPEMHLEPIRLAIGADMIVPLLDGVERLSLGSNCVCALRSFAEETFGPCTRMMMSCDAAYYESMRARNALPDDEHGIYSALPILRRTPHLKGH